MTETQATPSASHTHAGSCHCGAVTYDVDVDLGGTLIACNCSMCGRSGTVLTFVPPEKFTLKTGADDVTHYKFNKHVIDHVFCKTCGIKPYATGKTPDGNPMVAINVRCLEGVDVAALKTKQYDGASK